MRFARMPGSDPIPAGSRSTCETYSLGIRAGHPCAACLRGVSMRPHPVAHRPVLSAAGDLPWRRREAGARRSPALCLIHARTQGDTPNAWG